MIRLSVPLRQALARLTLPVMLMISLAVVLIGRADQVLADHLRDQLDDLLAPAYQMAAAPVEMLEHGGGAIGEWFNLRQENAELRAENTSLLQWQSVALALQAQNDALKSELHYVPSPTPRFFTGEVVADLGGIYARSVLVALPAADRSGSGAGLEGAVAMDGRGVVGRVVGAGSRAARVLLITDLNSRIPVALGASGTPALMAGTNGPEPSLQYWAPDHPPAEGAMVLTSAAGGAFPAGLPVGTVHYDSQNNPVVLPLADLSGLRLLRLFVYGSAAPALTPVPPPVHPARRDHLAVAP
jgi:rod shape-determining protein MreC